MIKMLSDTLSNIVKLNHGEFSKNHLCPSKIDMAYVYILFFKDKSIQNGPKVIMMRSDTLSDLDMVGLDEVTEVVKGHLDHPVMCHVNF